MLRSRFLFGEFRESIVKNDKNYVFSEYVYIVVILVLYVCILYIEATNLSSVAFVLVVGVTAGEAAAAALERS